MNCPLCQSDSHLHAPLVYECLNCSLIFKDRTIHLSEREDHERYAHHLNNIADQGYVGFLNRLLVPLKNFLPKSFVGLDFGCGPGPTLEFLLEECGGSMKGYDPFFFPEAHFLIPSFYDVVTCTEVVEHFKSPFENWRQLTDLLNDNGVLGVMTQFYSDKLIYKDWWYKNDPTHVCFYSLKTFEYIAKKFELKILYNDNKSVIIFKKQE